MRPDLATRFWSKVSPEPNTGCWLWTGTFGRGGYGTIEREGSTRRAHRVAWELTNGPIPPGTGAHGTCVCHRCDVRSCVNPAHLFLGTQSENIWDMVRKGRCLRPRGEKHGQARLTDAAVLEMLRLHAGGATYSGLGRRFGVSRQAATNAVLGVNWKHAGGVR